MLEFLHQDIAKLVIALLAGALIGAEREYKSKTIGFRTVILITVGSCLFTMLSAIMGGEKEPSRIASTIVTGIGFLGAGAIFREGLSVKGATTAATIWVSSAVGMSIGIGEYRLALVSTVVVVIVLYAFTWIQEIIDRSNANKEYHITLSDFNDAKQQQLEALFESCHISARATSFAKRNGEMVISYSTRGKMENHQRLVKKLSNDSLVLAFES